MDGTVWMLFSIGFPVLTGLLLLCVPCIRKRGAVVTVTAAGLVVTSLSVFAAVGAGKGTCTLLTLTEDVPVYFHMDGAGRLFASVVTIVWLCGGAFAFSYMKHEREEKRYFGCYLIVYGILNGLDFSGNIVTFYMFYEFMTIMSFPLVLHTRSREAIMAGLKYLFYSFCGAYLVLFGIYFLHRYGTTLAFTPGGVLSPEAVAGREAFLLLMAFLMILGFGVKAGMFPLHGWLPTAHPVAPAPASAVLSGIIVKSGVLGMLRVVYYLFGTAFLRGSWVQYVWLSLSLFTVFMGSLLAYREKVLKKRLAYSTVSQVSYILFGLAVMNQTALTGSMLHVVCHACIKSGLFLFAGAIIVQTGKTRVEELTGIGKEMPVLLWCYTICSLALIGIPPTGGFISKWYLAMGALEGGVLPVFGWLGPAVLLVSALLTAGYLLPVTIRGFFPGNGFDYAHLHKREPAAAMLLPILILTIVSVIAGMFPGELIRFVGSMI